MKTCSMCDREKGLEEFTKKRGGRAAHCKSCQAIKQREHYARNKEYYKKKNLKGKKRAQELVKELKSVPCADCGIQYPHFVMDFDHQRDKEYLLSQAPSRGLSEDTIRKEAAKCDVVCANCHRIRTWASSGFDSRSRHQRKEPK